MPFQDLCRSHFVTYSKTELVVIGRRTSLNKNEFAEDKGGDLELLQSKLLYLK